MAKKTFFFSCIWQQQQKKAYRLIECMYSITSVLFYFLWRLIFHKVQVLNYLLVLKSSFFDIVVLVLQSCN